jgi:hypothetical protein
VATGNRTKHGMSHNASAWPLVHAAAGADRRAGIPAWPTESPARRKQHARRRREKFDFDLGHGRVVSVESRDLTDISALVTCLEKILSCVRTACESGLTLSMLRLAADRRQSVDGFGNMVSDPYSSE